MHPSNQHKYFHWVLDSAGIPRIRFHDLRHTAASLMLNNDVSVIVVSKILGHAKPSTTTDIYGYLFNEMQDDAARIMDALVTPVQVELQKIPGNPGNEDGFLGENCTKLQDKSKVV